MATLERLRRFVMEMTALIERAGDEEERILEEGGTLLGALVAEDGWLPEAFAQPHPNHYQQYLLHCDPAERFSIVSFVWGPAQKTPVHDHRVWGLVGVLRGGELCRGFEVREDCLAAGEEIRLEPGQVTAVSPRIEDIHEVANAYDDRVSISIHVYGANIGAVARRVYDPATGKPKDFVSGYAAPVMPNLWDRSQEVRKALSES